MKIWDSVYIYQNSRIFDCRYFFSQLNLLPPYSQRKVKKWNYKKSFLSNRLLTSLSSPGLPPASTIGSSSTWPWSTACTEERSGESRKMKRDQNRTEPVLNSRTSNERLLTRSQFSKNLEIENSGKCWSAKFIWVKDALRKKARTIITFLLLLFLSLPAINGMLRHSFVIVILSLIFIFC